MYPGGILNPDTLGYKCPFVKLQTKNPVLSSPFGGSPYRPNSGAAGPILLRSQLRVFAALKNLFHILESLPPIQLIPEGK